MTDAYTFDPSCPKRKDGKHKYERGYKASSCKYCGDYIGDDFSE